MDFRNRSWADVLIVIIVFGLKQSELLLWIKIGQISILVTNPHELNCLIQKISMKSKYINFFKSGARSLRWTYSSTNLKDGMDFSNHCSSVFYGGKEGTCNRIRLAKSRPIKGPI